ncbi:MAG: SAM-dependent methyltransferase [Cytophagaceae bacterium]|nr:SAM-dependent methyltransferase [Cytophagaceae bacterium]
MRKVFLIPNLIAPDTKESVLPSDINKVLNQISYFFAEDVRTARRFLSDVKVEKRIEELKFLKTDKDTSREEIKSYFKEIPSEEPVGIISEAGCPCIADPGNLVVEYAHQMEWDIVPLVGPSSILLALIGSGLNGQSFVFHGYLPIEKDPKAKMIKSMEKDSLSKQQTQIFMETPYRNDRLLEEIVLLCNPETKLTIASNLTANDQFIRTKKVREWKNNLPELHKKPTIFLIQG